MSDIGFDINGNIEIKGQRSVDSLNDKVEKSVQKVTSLENVFKSLSNIIDKTFSKYKNATSSFETLSKREQQEIESFVARHNINNQKAANSFRHNVRQSETLRLTSDAGRSQQFIANYRIAKERESQERRSNSLAYSRYNQRQNSRYGFRSISDEVSNKRFASTYDEYSSKQIASQKRLQEEIRRTIELKKKENEAFRNSKIENVRNGKPATTLPSNGVIYANRYTYSEEQQQKKAKEADYKSRRQWTKTIKEEGWHIQDLEGFSNDIDTMASSFIKEKLEKKKKETQALFDKWKESNKTEGEEWEDLQDLLSPTSGDLTASVKKGNYSNFSNLNNLEDYLSDVCEAEEKIKAAKEEEAKVAEEALKDEKKIKNTRKNREMTENQIAQAEIARRRNEINADRVAKKQDENSEEFKQHQRTSDQAKLLNAQAKQAGALNRNWKYQAGRGLQNLGGIVGGMGTGGRLIGLGLDTAGSLLKAPALGASAAIVNLAKGISDLGKEAVKAFAEIESIKTQLGVVFSNQTQANTMFGEISQYAVKSPFGVQQTSELAVLLKQSGVYASDLMNTLKMIGDTAGGNMEKMKRIANNYAQIVSIGKASMLDMRQFAYAGIPIFEAVSKELGVSQQELRKLISDGKVTSDIIEKVFKDLTGINGIFENATEKGAKTLKARLQNLQDAKQLAFAAGGEWLTKLGTQSGNDSYTNQVVSWLEKIYQDIRDTVDTRNIEKSVKAIEERESRVKLYQDLIEKYADNPRMASIFAQALGVELQKRSKEQDRATYEASYQNKTRLAEDTYKQWGVSNWDELKQLSDIISMNGRNQYRGGRNSVTGGGVLNSTNYATGLEFARSKGYNIEDIYNMPDSDFKVLAESINEAVKAINGLKEVTDTEIKYHLESNTLQAQQLAYDQENKRASGTKSLNTSFQELLELQKSDKEYQRKQEEERKKRLQSAQDILKTLATKADESGNLDVTKLSLADYTKYNSLGAFTSGRKLNVVNGDGTANSEDVALLKTQFNHFMNEGLKTIGATDQKTAAALVKEMSSLNGNLSDTDYLEKFSGVLNNVKNILKGANLPEAVRNSIYESIIGSTYTHELTVGGQNVDLSKLLNISKTEFIPLWKRILSGATGLTTNGMTDTWSTMSNYRDDMAVRNMTSGVLTATMKSMGIDKAMSLMRTKSAVQLAGDSGKTFQIDWQATRKAIKDFSTQLSASTEVITAYKKGLEDELNTYEQLVAAGYTQAESTDLGSQKFVSTKQLEKLANGNSSQLVNAFGEVIKTKSGLTYNTSDITFENGKMFDKLGNEINEEVQITGKLFEFIKGELPRLYNELHEANVAELNNSLIKKMFNEISATSYLERYISNKGVNKQTILASQNQDYISSYLNSQLTAYKSLKDADDKQLNDEEKNIKKLMNKKFNGFSISSLSNEDFYLTAMTAPDRIKQLETQKSYYNSKETKTEEDKKTIQRLDDNINGLKAIIELIDKSFSNMSINLSNIMESSESSTLLGKIFTKQRDEAVLNDYIASRQFSKYGLADQTSLRPRDYTGERGARNKRFELLTGTELKYDREDYLAQAVKDPTFRKKTNEQRYTEWLGGGYKEGPLELLPEDNESILKMTNEELAKMLTTSEQIAVTWEKSSGELAEGFQNIGMQGSEMLRNFTSSAITSTFETWGKYLGNSSKASEEIEKNLQSLSAGMFKNMGQMVTQAGLSLAISSIGDKGKVMAGLAIAAAGGGLSFLGGMLDQDNDDDKEDDTYQKLLKVKQDLADLLKQAREDAIYYENTVRHKKAISANDYLTKSVHDAIITPRGDVVTTDPKDYLIATKTPKTLVGSGAPTINFNVIDKSTGIKVTQQKSTYNEDTNSIDFEAIIESKVQEVIATSKGDDAFAARQARINGRTVIA